MRQGLRTTFNVICGVIPAAVAVAQVDSATAPATLPDSPPIAAPDGPLRIVITAVTGTVQARQAEDQPWRPVQPGQQFPEGVEFRTGPKSAVTFDIPPYSSVTLDRLGTVKVLRAAIEDGTIRTDLGMKYGRTRYEIETADRKHQAKVRSASTVLAVRGTVVILEDTPGFPPRAISLTGRARFTDERGQTTAFGQADAARPVEVESGTDSAAETGLQRSVIRSLLDAGRTPGEQQVVLNIPQTGGLPPPSSFGGQLFLSSLGGGAPTAPTTPPIQPPPPPPDIPFIDGSLQFVLDWTGLADLNIGVISPAGEGITTNPAAVIRIPPQVTGPVGRSVPTGGQASADNTGVSGAGRETITWPSRFPQGVYEYGVKYNTGAGSATFRLSALVNGVELDPPVTGTLTGPTADEFTSGGAIEILPAPGEQTAQTAGAGRARRGK